MKLSPRVHLSAALTSSFSRPRSPSFFSAVSMSSDRCSLSFFLALVSIPHSTSCFLFILLVCFNSRPFWRKIRLLRSSFASPGNFSSSFLGLLLLLLFFSLIPFPVVFFFSARLPPLPLAEYWPDGPPPFCRSGLKQRRSGPPVLEVSSDLFFSLLQFTALAIFHTSFDLSSPTLFVLKIGPFDGLSVSRCPPRQPSELVIVPLFFGYPSRCQSTQLGEEDVRLPLSSLTFPPPAL